MQPKNSVLVKRYAIVQVCGDYTEMIEESNGFLNPWNIVSLFIIQKMSKDTSDVFHCYIKYTEERTSRLWADVHVMLIDCWLAFFDESMMMIVGLRGNGDEEVHNRI